MVNIREAKSSDAEAMRAVAQHAFHIYVDRMGKQPAPMLANFDYHLRFDSCLIAELDDEITAYVAGYVIIQFDDIEPLLDTIAVLPEHQGKRIGKALLLAAEALIGTAGYKSYQLYTNIHMTENIIWYERLGFTAFKTIIEDGFERIYMRKTL